jgi:hypothetical protein
MKTRFIGTCPICEGTYKVRGGAMVHHGFKRPGDGFIHGDCFAVGHPPYEVSCSITKTYRSSIEKGRADLVETLASAASILRFTTTRTGWGQMAPVQVEYVVGVSDPFVFERARDQRKHELEYRLRMTDAEIARLTKMIDAWQPRPVRKVEE